MADTVLEDLTAIEDFVRGCTFMGTGGGGDPSKGIESLASEVEKGATIRFTNSESIPDDEWTACPFLMGSIAPRTEQALERMKFFGLTTARWTQKDIMAEAVKELSNYTGVKISAIVPIELGGGNTSAALAAGTALGLAVVDGDYTGRAIPEIPQTTPYLNGLPMWPISSVDEWGNIVIIKEANNYLMAERIGKMVSAAAFGLTGQAGFLMKGRDMKKVVIPGTLTRCYRLGKTIREARESGQDPVKALIDGFGIAEIFGGIVSKKEWEDREGYFWGHNIITGQGKFEGQNLRIWFKNEHHITWKNDKPFVTSPDAIVVVRAADGEPLTNTQIAEGDDVRILAFAVPHFRTEKGLRILGPRHFGFDIDYRPVEQVISAGSCR